MNVDKWHYLRIEVRRFRPRRYKFSGLDFIMSSVHGLRAQNIKLPPGNEPGNFCKHPKQELRGLKYKESKKLLPISSKYRWTTNQYQLQPRITWWKVPEIQGSPTLQLQRSLQAVSNAKRKQSPKEKTFFATFKKLRRSGLRAGSRMVSPTSEGFRYPKSPKTVPAPMRR